MNTSKDALTTPRPVRWEEFERAGEFGSMRTDVRPFCPTCGDELTPGCDRCPGCGQALDWRCGRGSS